MTIKTLLMASAAALVSATAAGAADAVVYEPEPVEYVKVCDAYGAGFFYIPGTETCLKIDGYVRVQLGFTNEDLVSDVPNLHGFATGHYNPIARARLNFDARSDTEWGTLRSYIRFQSEWKNSGVSVDANTVADQAYLELGGLRMGYTESAWSKSMKGKVSDGGAHTDSGLTFGDQQRFLIAYTFASNGFAATLSLEDDDDFVANYVPDVVGVLSYNAGWGGVWAKLAYDEQIANIGAKLPIPAVPGFATNGSFAAQLGVQINVPNMKGSSFRLIGYYSDADNAYGPAPFRGTKFPYTTLGSAEWSVLASYRHQFSPTFAAVVAGQYFKDFYIAGTSINSNVDGWQGELELVWTPVENFEVRTAVAYRDIDAAGFNGSTSGFLRFVRSF